MISQRSHRYPRFESHVNLPPNMLNDSLDSLDKFTQDHDEHLQHQQENKNLTAGERYAKYRNSITNLNNHNELNRQSRNQFNPISSSPRYSIISTPKDGAFITYDNNARHRLESVENKIRDVIPSNEENSAL